MGKYILRRVLISLLTIFIVSVLVFALVRLLPGDPAIVMLGEGATPEKVAALRAELNLDKPYVKQYVLWVNDLIHGDFGTSVAYYHKEVADMIPDKVIATLTLTVPALLIAIILGLFAGTISALKRGSALDQTVTVLSTFGVGLPAFWIAIFLIFLFALKLKLLPTQGYVSPFVNFKDYIVRAILPIFCISLSFLATITRQTRSQMLEVLNQDYIRTARADGIKESRIITKHAIKNAAIPLVSIISLMFRMLIGGTIVIENVFNIPGIGAFALTCLMKRDYICVQAVTLIMAIVTVFGNLLADIMYCIIDPRIRERWAK
ncbi:MAG TPA: peptide ABC transporter [Sphaerochaeta sp.]|nr:peptide ABC transporter [Sphaerochaeta sp.]